MGKNIIFGSYSFGNVADITHRYVVVAYEGQLNEVRLVNASSMGSSYYCPEILLCKYLDSVEKGEEHSVYAYNARQFTVNELKTLYEYFIETHDIDAIILIDGGTDSLMAGDETGLGDPIEDCVSVTAVSQLDDTIEKILLTVGFGSDRFNDVTDSSSFRAVAELTAMGGMLGIVSIEKDSQCHQFYRDGISFIYDNQTFRSVLTGLILESIDGNYGLIVPKGLESRVQQGEAYCWPLMSLIWGFDVNVVVKRSQLADVIKDCSDIDKMFYAFRKYRDKLNQKKLIRSDE